jgi:Protein of unknown function (DUF3489)
MRRIWRRRDLSETMKTNPEATTTENTAAVAEQVADVAQEKASSKKGTRRKKGSPSGQKRAKAAKPAAKPKARQKGRQSKTGEKPVEPREGTAKANVLAMIQRKGGAMLDEIVKATAWQKHTVRGFLSVVPKKAGLTVTSTRRESDKARVYEAK